MVRQREVFLEKEKNYYMKSVKQEGKVVKGSFQEIAKILADEMEKLIEPGVHNILIYKDLKSFREIYSSIQGLSYPKMKSL